MPLHLLYWSFLCIFFKKIALFFLLLLILNTGFAQWDQHIDVTTTLSLPARLTIAACLCGLSATATTTAEMTAMSRDVVSL